MDGLCDRSAFVRDLVLLGCALPLIASASRRAAVLASTETNRKADIRDRFARRVPNP